MQYFDWKYNDIRFAGTVWIPEAFHKVLVIVHGIGEHIGRYAHMAEFFNQKGYVVIGIDHYGHGRSEGKRGACLGYEFYFDYLEAFLNYVAEQYKVPVNLYGHSMGGGIVTGFVLKRQPVIQAVVISSPALIVAKKLPSFLLTLLKGINALVPNLRIKQGLDVNKISHDKDVVTAFNNDPLNHDRMSIRLAYEMITNGQWCIDHAGQLRLPALLIHGNADEFTSVEGSRIFASKAPPHLLTYKEWDGGYHEMHNEPEKLIVLQYIFDWLQVIDNKINPMFTSNV